MGIPNANFPSVPLVHIRKLSTQYLYTLWGAHGLYWSLSFTLKYAKYVCLTNALMFALWLGMVNYHKYSQRSQGCLGIYDEKQQEQTWSGAKEIYTYVSKTLRWNSYQLWKLKNSIKRNRTYDSMPMVTKVREKPAQTLSIPTVLAFCLQILIVLTYWELHIPLTAVSQLWLHKQVAT